MREGHDMPITVPLVDIAQALARAGCPGNRCDRYRLYEEWARDFQADFEARTAAGRKPERTYLHDVTAFALRRATAYGFDARCEDFGARLCSEARLVAGVR
jgi:copper oxidase (laccase) domain-containing protein